MLVIALQGKANSFALEGVSNGTLVYHEEAHTYALKITFSGSASTGSSGGGFGSGSLVGPKITGAVDGAAKPLSQNQALKAITGALKGLPAGAAQGSVRFTGVSAVTAETLKAAAAKAQKRGVTLPATPQGATPRSRPSRSIMWTPTDTCASPWMRGLHCDHKPLVRK